jgi:glycine cleavage system H protein
MRPHFAPPADGAAGTRAPVPAAHLEPGRRYSRGHCWAQAVGESGEDRLLVRVGLEPGLAAALLRPRTVVQPRPGDPLHKGEAHLWVVTDGGTFPVAAPVSGHLRRANPALAERPSLVVTQPFAEGWLYEMEAERGAAELEALLDAEAADRLYAQDARRFRQELAEALRSSSAETPTLADGGVALGTVSDMLGATRYFALLRMVYG